MSDIGRLLDHAAGRLEHVRRAAEAGEHAAAITELDGLELDLQRIERSRGVAQAELRGCELRRRAA